MKLVAATIRKRNRTRTIRDYVTTLEKWNGTRAVPAYVITTESDQDRLTSFQV
jgi:hypothetical protein